MIEEVSFENPLSEAPAETPDKYACFENRELSWLKFNMRVLEEGEDPANPLCERLNFISIYQTNLDEFFMVRVGALTDQMLEDDHKKDSKSGMRPSEVLEEIEKRVRRLSARHGRAYENALNELRQYGVKITNFSQLEQDESEYLEAYFRSAILPMLTPVLITEDMPIPFLNNLDLYAFASVVNKDGIRRGAIIPCSRTDFPRLIRIPGRKHEYILSEELILHFMPLVFPRYRIQEKAVLRVTRSADLPTDRLSEDVYGYRDLMEQLITGRKRLMPVRLEYSRNLDKKTIKTLCKNLGIKKERAFLNTAPSDLSFLSDLREDLHDNPELFYQKRAPQPSYLTDESRPMIPQVEDHDILLYYPCERMAPMLQLLDEAAHDPSVVSIRMTLYRVAKNSQVIRSLVAASEAGKRVDVVVELKARFDEENNIRWSRLLEDAGCHVRFGLMNYKVHSKLMLITRKQGNDLEYITQVGTGNYNESTARGYTDLCLITANQELGREAESVFNALISNTVPEDVDQLLVAPHRLRDQVLAKIDREITLAKIGAGGYVGFKLNAITDKTVIKKLIEASQAGVQVDLIVRGPSCLRTGIPGMTDNIRLVSIVGRYLEHARVYIFGKDGENGVYISSADMMTRNTIRRVEVAAPVTDPQLKERILHIFELQMSDNVKARLQRPDGKYRKVKAPEDAPLINAQELLFDEAYAESAAAGRPAGSKEQK